MRNLVVVMAILAAPAMAFAQDSSFFEPEMASALQGYNNRQDYFSARLSGSIPVAGMAFEDADGNNVTYDDIFRPGVIAGVEWGIIYRSPKDYWTGGYLNLSAATYSGEDNTDSIGKLQVNDFEMVSAMAGIRVIKWRDNGTSFEGFMAVGWLLYSSLDGEYAGIPGDVEIFNRTSTAVGEFGFRMGWGDHSFAFQVGLSARVAKGPRYSRQLTGNGETAETLVTAQLDFGIQVGF